MKIKNSINLQIFIKFKHFSLFIMIKIIVKIKFYNLHKSLIIYYDENNYDKIISKLMVNIIEFMKK